MSTLILYHGSPSIIEHPIFDKGKAYNDYGKGFYCTEHIELAKEWACSENADGFANRYEIDLSDLTVLNLSSDDFMILNWLAILMLHRKARLSTPLAKRGKDYLIQNFLPAFQSYDVIVGYRADDSYFSFARSFVNNEISLKQLGYAMKLGKLGEQFVLKSQKAFETIRFLDYEIADNTLYYAKRKVRDDEAREAYNRELENEDLDRIFMRDIIREEIKPNDPRLR
ncbi:DUF3990 domain-containing protein [Hominifimenecus sp. rT4P-3]|uniref:DUF3990 domain-containing protein n=1 Tax=Hominifimenecus sp. rT4P-3 TaxID=3242979 RepID=UPI003DA6352A